MDTKLKNRHKLAIVLIVAALAVVSIIMVENYGKFYRAMEERQELEQDYYQDKEELIKEMLMSSYVLYYAQGKGDDAYGYLPRSEYTGVYQVFEGLAPYVNYQMEIAKETTTEDSASKDSAAEDTNADDSKATSAETENTTIITDTEENDILRKWDQYAFGVAFGYDENGTPYYLDCIGDREEETEKSIRRIIGELTDYPLCDPIMDNELPGAPVHSVFYFGMTQENLDCYLVSQIYVNESAPDIEVYTFFALAMLMILLAMLLPRFKTLHTGEERIFHAPFEAVLIIGCCTVAWILDPCGWLVARNTGRGYYPEDFLIWMAVFAVAYWIGGCTRQIYTLGIKGYLAQRVLCVKLWEKSGLRLKSIYEWIKEKLHRLYHSFYDIDLKEKNTKVILKIVAVNFCILLICCMMWVFGIFALLIYSLILFFILRKCFDDIRTKYALLLEATGEIAKGNLDVEIKEDLGIFSPFREEIQKIQSGFKKAVKEEVKSQRMKTELITNVSHDLKTPLTAIITYVDLLKEETDEEKRKSYIDVLDQKSMRLKVLIEDLFEISKANSDNISLNLVQVDIVNLFKQVELELDEKIKAADLTLRTDFPEEKVNLLLDSQKTYRIFENLLVNVAKYALGGTRVYVEIRKEEKEAVIRIKNISATELNFNPDEITDRFVRGDVSRNTEGSGLGLAIVKSFVELQKGTFVIETEADLFKAEIRWPLVLN